MERALQTLHLSRDLAYRLLGGPLDESPTPGPSLPDSLRVYELSGLVSTGSEGPQLCAPLSQAPLLRRLFESEAFQEGDTLLARGDWLFRQREDASDTELTGIIEAFIRDSWWEGRKTGDALFVRRIYEDGRTVLQMWARICE